jgi:hypothetical protein
MSLKLVRGAVVDLVSAVVHFSESSALFVLAVRFVVHFVVASLEGPAALSVVLMLKHVARRRGA